MIMTNGYGALPSLKTQLKKGGEYTIILTPDRWFLPPPESKIRNELETRIYPSILKIVSIERTLFSSRYVVTFKLLKDMTFETLTNYIQTVFKDMIGSDVSVMEFKTQLLPTKQVGLMASFQEELKPLIYIAFAGIAIIYLAPTVTPVVKNLFRAEERTQEKE